MKILVNLIGEQPIPNLLPILFLKPDKTIIIYTDKTIGVANRLINLIHSTTNIKTVLQKKKVDAYNIDTIIEKLDALYKNKAVDEYIFNITGGTKLMSIGLFQFAIQNNSQVVYLQSEKNSNLLYKFILNNNERLETISNEIPELLNVDMYLKAHLNGYYISKDIDQNQFGIKYENAVVQVLRDNNFEVLQSVKPVGEGDQLEIDIAFRLKGTNNVGIAEVKIGDYKMEKPKKGIDQLSTAGSREYLGTYTKKFLITRRKINKSLYKLAEAHNIIVIDRISANNKNVISEIAQKKLITTITKHLK